MKLQIDEIALLLSCFVSLTSSKKFIISSCSEKTTTKWNDKHVESNLRSWLKSVSTISVGPEDGLKSARYYPIKREFGPHFDMEDVADFHDNPTDTGVNDEEYEDEEVIDTDAEKGFITIGHFVADKPVGKAWQWKHERLIEGFLTGSVDENGKFSGKDIIYIYPDLQTGLRGKFVDGEVAEARSVIITEERCNNGMKEVRTRLIEADQTLWSRDISNATHITKYAKTVDPHEKRSVYVGESQLAGGGEGIFARRSFLPGQLVSYFNGIRVTEDMMFYENMTEGEEYEVGRYYFGLGGTAPYSWGINHSINLDIPERFRNIVDYRTTLGHKVNHKFDPDSNTQFMAVKHALFGPICGLVATKVIDKGEEVFVDYNYDVDATAGDNWTWYRDAKEKHQQQLEGQV